MPDPYQPPPPRVDIANAVRKAREAIKQAKTKKEKRKP